MPLRYSKVLRGIFKEILHMQHIGLLDAATDDKLREYLHTHRKAIRELTADDVSRFGGGIARSAKIKGELT